MTNRYARPIFLFFATLTFICLLVQSACAEPIEQVITLRPGWNAVFLEVNPQSADCEEVFRNLTELQSVWSWNPQVSTVEYIQDPDTLIPEQPEWRVYLPDNPVVTNLHGIYGAKPYLIKIGGTEDVTWRVTGEPRLPDIKWQPDSFNFVGFHLDPENEPFWGDFFRPSPAHDEQEIYYLDASGEWKLATRPASTRMHQGEAFWVYTKGHSEYQGPLSVQLSRSDGVHYGQALNEQSVKITNHSEADAALTFDLEPGQQLMPLYHWHFGQDPENPGWQEFPLNLNLPAKQYKTVRLGVRRAGLSSDQEVLSNLVINNNNGTRIFVPASVTGIDYTGLWVGATMIQKVSEPRTAPDTLSPAGSQLSFRLILHVDDGGTVRLLKQAIQLWDKANNRYVLATDDDLVSTYTDGSTTRVPAVRRISSAAFGRLSNVEPRWELPMSGSFAEADGNLSCAFSMAPGAELNPFLHQYHPDHKNSERSYEITREIEMIFSQTDTDGNVITKDSSLTWSGSDMGGIYRETFSGLHRNAIKVEGIFLLHKVSSVGQITR